MRILRIIASVDPKTGGPIEGLLRSTEYLSAQGHETEVITLDPPDAPCLAGLSFPVHTVPKGPRWTGSYPIGLRGTVKNRARYNDVGIVHGFWNWATITGGLALLHAGLPYVVFAHGMLDPWFTQTNPRKRMAKQVVWTLAQGRVAAGATRVLFTTSEEMTLAKNAFRSHEYRSRTVAYAGAPVPPATPEQSAALDALLPGLKARPYLLYLGRLHEKKGCDLLIDAFARLADQRPELQLVMAGEAADGYGQTLRQLAQHHGVAPRVHWPGMVSGLEKSAVFNFADTFVLPSHQENFGIAVAEALSAGLPVLTTHKVNTWREVEDGGAGWAAPDTVEGLQQLLTRWFQTTPEERRAMSVAAKATYDRHFRIETAGASLLQTLVDATQPMKEGVS